MWDLNKKKTRKQYKIRNLSISKIETKLLWPNPSLVTFLPLLPSIPIWLPFFTVFVTSSPLHILLHMSHSSSSCKPANSRPSNLGYQSVHCEQNEIYCLIIINHFIIKLLNRNNITIPLPRQTLWNSVWFTKQSLTYAIYLSWSSMNFLTRTCNCTWLIFRPFQMLLQ